ncbi:hypothetical protein [Enterobacter sp. R1(2018)]|uniref:hypothetical protein n=1 Tax=Enterobacter sp. R1(2018) TaxID=2447891 RepID=UPI000EAD8181|nr:hypothetical protein [Enterobacter sp. R1(2018)]RKQ38372.1 hypothetical protein D8M09_17355 [Enterobacter sp. R1(2018)]
MSEILKHIGNTIFCMYQKPFSHDWDRRLREAITNGEVVEAGRHTIEIKHGNDLMSIWISNRWYSFGNLFYINGNYVDEELQFRPRFRTMQALWDLYQRERRKHLAGEYEKLFL